MRKFKSVLIGLILLTVTTLMAVLSWLWQHNNDNHNPLPIATGQQALLKPSVNDTRTNANLTSIDNEMADAAIQVCAVRKLQPAINAAVVSFERRYTALDVEVTYNDSLQQLNQCGTLQQDLLLFSEPMSTNVLTELKVTETDVRPFSYALRGELRLEGALLTDKTGAISLRNYLLSSVGQDILTQYGYDNIDGYKNNVDDLFNPKGSLDKQASVDLGAK